ncbi:MAG: hypothetical protein ACTSSG_05630 [Candidatus Heimdallarchaeaceae archaeon]
MLIKRILIITSSGVPIFDFEDYSRGDEILVSGLITAILKFVEETEKEKLSRVLLEESQFLLTSTESLIFVFQISDEMPTEYAEHVIKHIIESFNALYKEKVSHFTGNVSVFSEFQTECRVILQQCGLNIANTLLSNPEGKKLHSWCMFSENNEILVVRALIPNYNIDSFPIYQVLGKSLRKVLRKMQNGSNKGICLYITLEGHVIYSIVLPFITFISETRLKELQIKKIKQFKTKTNEQLKSIFKEIFSPNRISVYSKSVLFTTLDEETTKHEFLFDLFKAAEKGFTFLFNSSIYIQSLKGEDHTITLVKLFNRIILFEHDEQISSEIIFTKVKKLLELEHGTKVDILEPVLEKS